MGMTEEETMKKFDEAFDAVFEVKKPPIVDVEVELSKEEKEIEVSKTFDFG
jgi:hypothetical protein